MGLLAAGDSAIGTWVFNSTITMKPSLTAYAVDFTSSGYTFSSIGFYAWGQTNLLAYSGNYVYSSGSGWSGNGSYRTITITGGTDITNADFISWLQANATRS